MLMPYEYDILGPVWTVGDEVAAFCLARRDPYLRLLRSIMEEPFGTDTANRAGQLTAEWWDAHGKGPTRHQLIDAMFPEAEWKVALEDKGRTQGQRRDQRDLLARWLIAYWTRLGTIAYLPDVDAFVRPSGVVVAH